LKRIVTYRPLVRIAIGISAVALSCCSKEKFADEIQIDLPPFHTVVLKGQFDVYLSEDTDFGARLAGDSRVLDDFEYTCADSILKVDMVSHSKWITPTRNKVELFIRSKPLKLIEAEGTCNIRTETPITSEEFGLIMKGKTNEAHLDLNCQTFYYWNNHPTGGFLELSGNSDVLKIWNAALLTVDARNLKTKYALVENDALTDCIVNVTEELEYKISGAGNIQLYGQPAVTNLGTTSGGQLILH